MFHVTNIPMEFRVCLDIVQLDTSFVEKSSQMCQTSSQLWLGSVLALIIQFKEPGSFCVGADIIEFWMMTKTPSQQIPCRLAFWFGCV